MSAGRKSGTDRKFQKGKSAPKSLAVHVRERPIITLITDFGEGYYVGAMKGAILDVCSDANIVDITHNIRSHDVIEASFTLLCTYPYYPSNSIHVVVVDPEVGSDRRGIVLATEDHYFVGPDNGVFSFVSKHDPVKRAVSIDSRKYFRKRVSPTFHGRDIFGPVAAWLTLGAKLDEIGQDVEYYSDTTLVPVQKLGETRVAGMVIHVDKFGNIVTSISPQDLVDLLGSEGTPKFVVNEQEITCHYRFYAEAGRDEIFSLLGSSGYYEIARSRGRAADLLQVERGSRVELELVSDWTNPSDT